MTNLKKLFLSMAMAVAILPSFAQDGIGYKRNSMSIIIVNHGDSYDAISNTWMSQEKRVYDRFDENVIATRNFKVQYNRYVEPDENTLSSNNTTSANMRNTYLRTNIASVGTHLAKENVARQILAFWFDRRATGDMDLNLIGKRAKYSSTDRAFQVTNSQALGEYLLQTSGLDLIEGSYVMVVDHGQPEKRYDRNSSGQATGVSWSTRAFGYLYQIVYNDAVQKQIFDAWIYPGDPALVRTQKNNKWDLIPFSLKFVDCVTASSSASHKFTDNDNDEIQSMNRSITGCVNAVADKFLTKVEGWTVRNTLEGVNPPSSKIGMKESVKNLSRFKVVEYVLDDNGNTSERRRGYLRASYVADNREDWGRSLTSEFCQVAGGTLEPGMALIEKRSLNFDLKLLYYGGASKGYGLELDLMQGLTVHNSLNHFRMGFSFGKYKEGLTSSVSEYYLKQDLHHFDARLGYGRGFHFLKAFEVIPGANMIANVLSTNDDFKDKELSTFDTMGFGLEAGVGMNVNLFYPVKLNAGAYYTGRFFGGQVWKVYDQGLREMGYSRNGFTWRVGLLYEF